jgi:hypothetical protein
VLGGFAPDAVYDETGEKIEVQVSTPIVNRAEDQGVTLNPLGAAWRYGDLRRPAPDRIAYGVEPIQWDGRNVAVNLNRRTRGESC